jgi:hypothetical protein
MLKVVGSHYYDTNAASEGLLFLYWIGDGRDCAEGRKQALL